MEAGVKSNNIEKKQYKWRLDMEGEKGMM